jgi:DNA-binding CsgD family transcriptional regulator
LPKVVGSAEPTRREMVPLTPLLTARTTDWVSALPPTTRALLLLAALDEGGELSTLRAAAPGCDVVADLDAARHARLIAIDAAATNVTFANAVARSAVVDASTCAERRAAHQRLAAALTDRPDRRAWHLADATAGPDEEVAVLLEAAAQHAERVGNPVEAAWAMSRSADLSPDPARRARRLVAAADLHVRATGELRRASEALAEAGRLDPESRSSPQSAITSAFLALHADGNIDSAHRTLTAAISGSLNDDDPIANEAMRAALLAVCRFGARAELWEPYFQFADRRGADGVPQHLNHVEQVAAAATYLDRVAPSRLELLAIIENTGGRTAVTSVINALTRLALDDLRSGRWDDAQAGLDYGRELCQGNDFRFLAWPLQFGQAMLSAARGDTATTERLADAMTRGAGKTGAHQLRNYAHHALALCALGGGDYQAAYEHAAAIAAPGTLPVTVPHALSAALELVEAAVRTNEPAAARAHLHAMHVLGVSDRSPRLRLVVAVSEAMAAPAEECVPLFERALALPDASLWPFDYARLQLMYGERLRRDRAISRARVQLASALAIFQRLNAVPWAAHAEAELFAAGVTGARPAVTAPGVLTPQEHRVATLAASGMSNRQIAERLAISPRTVSAHLQQVFPKLAINSRSALRAALSQQPDPAAEARMT